MNWKWYNLCRGIMITQCTKLICKWSIKNISMWNKKLSKSKSKKAEKQYFYPKLSPRRCFWTLLAFNNIKFEEKKANCAALCPALFYSHSLSPSIWQRCALETSCASRAHESLLTTRIHTHIDMPKALRACMWKLKLLQAWDLQLDRLPKRQRRIGTFRSSSDNFAVAAAQSVLVLSQ